jgi:NitT/TauT family transport system substrate-binding protein
MTNSCSLLAKFVTAALAVGAVAAAPQPARAQMEQTTVALPATAIVFLSAYVAEDAHLYAKAGLDVKTVFITGVGAFNAVVSGSADFSNSSGLSFNRAAAHGQRMLAIANTLDRLPMEIVLRKDIADAIHFDPAAPLSVRAQAIKGRTMAVDSINSIVHAYLRVIGKAGGYDPELITVAPLQPPDMLGALDRKAIDGFSNGPPWPQKVVTEGNAVYVAGGIKGDPPGINPLAFNVIVARPSYCQDHRSICVKMGHAMVDAAQFIQDHPDETLGFLKQRFKEIGDAALTSAFNEVRAATPRLPSVSAIQLANADKLNLDAGLMKPEDKVASYDGLFTDEFLK